MRRGLFLWALVGILSACRPAVVEQRVPEPTEAQIERAEAGANALIKQLGGRLIAELESSGPLAAIDVCSSEAQRIAQEHSSDGLRLRRVSLKVRNLADVPDAWETARLLELEELAAQNDLPQRVVAVEETPDGYELRYLKPLQIAPPCLNCHGNTAEMDDAVIAKLDELYPDDEALGYALGDFRGAVSVRMPLPTGG